MPMFFTALFACVSIIAVGVVFNYIAERITKK